MTTPRLNWQSQLVLLAVIPCTAIELVFQVQNYVAKESSTVLWILGLSATLGIAAFAAKAGTPPAAATGALITASLMFSTAQVPFHPRSTGLTPVLTVLILTTLATRFGRRRKERLGTAEARRGRLAAQVCANLGVAALIGLTPVQIWLIDSRLFAPTALAPLPVLAPLLAALAEAAADTISSEIGQVLGGIPVMLTTFRRVPAGTDGGITAAGTIAGILAAGVVASAGTAALHGGPQLLLVSWAGGVFGLFFDSLLGATLERKGWLNNDAVNFLSTGSAAAFSLGILAILPHPGVG